ncbi:MAG: alpha-L-rhamnosidase N-terminal domain-containing protein, partial [Kiritimatiellae bacterium]|nr:alpha-L-rhamnosidase N-terminal domain-containing protein [Kiritimatiellia bacterium]
MRKAEGKARVHCTADSKYRLWINGEYIGFGPARGHSEHPYYDTHVVPLRAGRNTIAFLVQHYTEGGNIFSPVEGGLICQVEVGTTVVATTDGSWGTLSSKAYRGIAGMIFPESFDARAEPHGWQQPGFNATSWPAAKVLSHSKLAPPRNLLPRPIPLIKEKRLVPAQLLDTWQCQDIDVKRYTKEQDIAGSLWGVQQDRLKARPSSGALQTPRAWSAKPLRLDLGVRKAVCLILDFGKETLASPEIVAQGPSGVILDLGYSECLDNDLVPTLWQGCRQSERIVLRNGQTQHRITQPRGFRFMILRVANVGQRRCRVSLEDVAAYEALYPTEPKGSFKCSDPLLNRTFALAARTVNLCMEDGYTDCPWRERSQWVGDAQPEALFSYFCFGAYDLARKAVIEFTSGNTAEGWIPGVFPVARPFNLPTWGMRVPVIGWEYYLYSGDRSALPAMYEGVRKQMAWLANYENKDGLLVGLPGWCFVDWTKLDATQNDGAVQGWYLEALDGSANLAREAGDTQGWAAFRGKAAILRKSLAPVYWSDKRKAFLKYRKGYEKRPAGISCDLIGQHENFLFCLLKVGTATQRRQALDAMAGATGRYLPNLGDYQSSYRPDGQHGCTLGADDVIRIGSPFWSYYALLALMEANRTTEALEYIRLCWGLMLEHGATSCWEMWDRHTSLCHGWSAAPAMILPTYVLGVAPLQPGFRLFEVRP